SSNDRVLRYDGMTGDFLDNFVPTGSGGLSLPSGIAFGPDSNLYVNSYFSNEILRYDGTTGAFIDAFVSSGSGGLVNPDYGQVFGPDGNLYIPELNGDQSILRYDGKTGAFINVFVLA